MFPLFYSKANGHWGVIERTFDRAALAIDLFNDLVDFRFKAAEARQNEFSTPVEYQFGPFAHTDFAEFLAPEIAKFLAKKEKKEDVLRSIPHPATVEFDDFVLEKRSRFGNTRLGSLVDQYLNQKSTISQLPDSIGISSSPEDVFQYCIRTIQILRRHNKNLTSFLIFLNEQKTIIDNTKLFDKPKILMSLIDDYLTAENNNRSFICYLPVTKKGRFSRKRVNIYEEYSGTNIASDLEYIRQDIAMSSEKIEVEDNLFIEFKIDAESKYVAADLCVQQFNKLNCILISNRSVVSSGRNNHYSGRNAGKKETKVSLKKIVVIDKEKMEASLIDYANKIPYFRIKCDFDMIDFFADCCYENCPVLRSFYEQFRKAVVLQENMDLASIFGLLLVAIEKAFRPSLEWRLDEDDKEWFQPLACLLTLDSLLGSYDYLRRRVTKIARPGKSNQSSNNDVFKIIFDDSAWRVFCSERRVPDAIIYYRNVLVHNFNNFEESAREIYDRNLTSCYLTTFLRNEFAHTSTVDLNEYLLLLTSKIYRILVEFRISSYLSHCYAEELLPDAGLNPAGKEGREREKVMIARDGFREVMQGEDFAARRREHFLKICEQLDCDWNSLTAGADFRARYLVDGAGYAGLGFAKGGKRYSLFSD